MKKARILERDRQGRGSIVAYEIDARIKTVRYQLRQIYDEPARVASQYLDGDFHDFAGEWRFQPRDDGGTHAELDLRIDPAASSQARCAPRSPTPSCAAPSETSSTTSSSTVDLGRPAPEMPTAVWHPRGVLAAPAG